jgi:hypothetical protein
MYDELQIGDRIDEHIAQDFEEREVSIGQAVKALVLNGFGLVQQRLYLTPKFFERLPTERLIGEGIQPEGALNDDTLGRALDSLYDYGVTELLRDLSAHASRKFSGSALRPGLRIWMRPVSWPMGSTIRSGRLKTEWSTSGRDIPEITARISTRSCST